MGRFLSTVLTAAAFLVPSVAVAQKVQTDYDHSANFERYKTYKLVKIKDNPDVNQLADQRIVSAIEAQLAKEGLTKTEDNPDLLVGYQAAIHHETQLNTFGTSMGGPAWGYGPGWGYGWGGGMGTTTATTTTSTIRNGTLAIDMMDPQRKQLVFRGVATDTLSDKPEKNTKKLNKALAKIFDKYPPKEKG